MIRLTKNIAAVLLSVVICSAASAIPPTGVVRVAIAADESWSVAVSESTRVSVARAIVHTLRGEGRSCETVSVATLQRLATPQPENPKSPTLAIFLEHSDGGNFAHIAASEGFPFDIVCTVSEGLRGVGYKEVLLVTEESLNSELLRVSKIESSGNAEPPARP